MKRGTPLKTYTPLARKTRLRQVSERRVAQPVKRTRTAPAVSAGVRSVLLDRSDGYCEMALTGCLGTGTDPAHRLARKAGGRKGAAKAANDRPSNALWACRRCHGWSEARPAESYELGLMLREGQEPTQEPVVRRGVLVFLTDDGAVLPFEQVAA